MPEEIELKAKSDRELLVMTVMQGNETVRHLELINGSLKNHEGRIRNLETGDYGDNPVKRINLSKSQAIGAGSGLFVFGSFLAGMFYAFGSSMGWW